MRIQRMDKRSLMRVVVLTAIFLLEVTPGVAEQYYCEAAKDICNYNRSALTLDVGCMNSGAAWVCHRTLVGTAECAAGSLKTSLPLKDWDSAQKVCDLLCHACNSRWSQQQSGGSTY